MFNVFLVLKTEVERAYVSRLFWKYEKKMYRSAYDILNNEKDAEDMVQAVFCQVVDHWDRLPKDENEAGPYLMRAVVNQSINVYRARRNHPQYELTDSDCVTNEDTLEHMVTEEEVQRCMETLDPRSRSMLYERELYDMSYEEIAEKWNTTAENVRQIVSRARKKLRSNREKEESRDVS